MCKVPSRKGNKGKEGEEDKKKEGKGHMKERRRGTERRRKEGGRKGEKNLVWPLLQHDDEIVK
jgi:hypothetical protein